MIMKNTISWFSSYVVDKDHIRAFIKATVILIRISVFSYDYEMLYQPNLIYYFNFICLKNKRGKIKQVIVSNIHK